MRSYEFTINGNPYKVSIKNITEERADVVVNGNRYDVQIDAISSISTPPLMINPIKKSAAASPYIEPPSMHISSPVQASKSHAGAKGVISIVAPIPGTILKILAEEGQKIEAGQIVIKMEAMKMENEIKATSSGYVKKILVKESESVLEGAELVILGEAG